MAILMYSANDDSDEERLLRSIADLSIDVCRSTRQLKDFLNRPKRIRRIVLLVIRNRDEMTRISHLVGMYFDLRLIAVLDRDAFETFGDAHKFRPRYITFKDGDFEDVASVVRRMMKSDEVMSQRRNQ